MVIINRDFSVDAVIKKSIRVVVIKSARQYRRYVK